MDQAKLNQVLVGALQIASGQYLDYAKHSRGLVDLDGRLPPENRRLAESFDRQAADCDAVIGMILRGRQLQWQEPPEKKPGS